MTLYESLASDLERSIRSGTLRPGEKMPSVRYTSRSRGVSMSTVFQAYYLLEARGLIRARERSGYFVVPTGRLLPEPVHATNPSGDAVSLDVSDLIFRILEGSRSRDDAGLASAFPSAGLYPFPRLVQVLQRANRGLDPRHTVDDLTPGNPELRRQIAIRYGSDGVAVDPQEIVITNGALEALNLCLAAVTQPGDAVIIECPSFYGALQSLEARGLRAVQVPTHPREGVELATLEAAIERHRPKACWLMTSFQNPLGTLMSPERKRALVDLLARHDVALIEDDVYAELYFTEKRPPPAKAFDKEGLVLHCSSFSKSLAPGFRVGWVAPGRFATKVARAKLAFNLGCSVPPQLAIAEYLAHGGFDKHLRQLRRTLQERQSHAAQAVARHFPPGTTATRPEGGYQMWVELPAGCDTLDLYWKASPHGACVAPGPMFSPSRAFRNCLRLNYSHAWLPRQESAVDLLGRLLREQLAPRPARERPSRRGVVAP
jgi:DNA-binding transcriptional MocR family regulator